MLRASMIVLATATLGLGAASARADHGEELRYVVGGALIGAALGELVYVETRGHRYHGYHPRPRGWDRHYRAPGRFAPYRHPRASGPYLRHHRGGWGHVHRRGFCYH